MPISDFEDFIDQTVTVTVSNSDGEELVTLDGAFVVDHEYEGTRTVIVRDENGDLRWVEPTPDQQVDIRLAN